MFDGIPPVNLVEFLASLKEAFDELGNVGGVAVRAFSLFLLDDARKCYLVYGSHGVAHRNVHVTTWAHVIHELLTCFLTGDVLRTAYDTVTGARKETNEDELAFDQWIEEITRERR